MCLCLFIHFYFYLFILYLAHVCPMYVCMCVACRVLISQIELLIILRNCLQIFFQNASSKAIKKHPDGNFQKRSEHVHKQHVPTGRNSKSQSLEKQVKNTLQRQKAQSLCGQPPFAAKRPALQKCNAADFQHLLSTELQQRPTDRMA